MQLSDNTIQILQNFMTINPSIVVRAGKVIKTMNSQGTIFGKADVEDEFPKDFAIHDLSKFISLLTLSKEKPEIEFGDKQLTMRRGRSKTVYTYCAENLIKSPPYDKDVKLKNAKAKFKLDQDVWNEVQKAMSIMGFSEIAFVSEDGKLSVQAVSTMEETSDTFECAVGETDLNFQAVVKLDRMKMIPGNYDATVTEKAIAFKGDIAEYVVAFEAKSTRFED